MAVACRMAAALEACRETHVPRFRGPPADKTLDSAAPIDPSWDLIQIDPPTPLRITTTTVCCNQLPATTTATMASLAAQAADMIASDAGFRNQFDRNHEDFHGVRPATSLSLAVTGAVP